MYVQKLRNSLTGKLSIKVLFGWFLTIFIFIYLTSSAMYSTNSITRTTSLSHEAKEFMPQAFVFIAMGEMAREHLVEDSIASVRLLGRWNEDIIILTDREKCFDNLKGINAKTRTIYVKPKNSIMEIKTMKAEIFDYLPSNINKILYMDIDVIVTRNLGLFLQDLTKVLVDSKKKSIQNYVKENKISHITNTTSINYFDYAAFPDSAGHFVGFCADCEKWHTGVMYLRRDQGKECLKEWANILGSGMYGTDQQSLDHVSENKLIPYNSTLSPSNSPRYLCKNTVTMPSRHLLFAKDYLAMLFTSGHTFLHLTSANRKEDEGSFYKEYVVPKLRNNLHPPLPPYHANAKLKQC